MRGLEIIMVLAAFVFFMLSYSSLGQGRIKPAALYFLSGGFAIGATLTLLSIEGKL